MTTALGSISFLDTPDVNGVSVLTASTGIQTGGVSGTANQIILTGNTVSLAPNFIAPGTEGITVPVGTTAQRAVTPTIGEVRWNTTLAFPEIYSGSVFLPFARVLQTVSANWGQVAGSAYGVYTASTTAPTFGTGTSVFVSPTITPISTTSKFIITTTFSVASTTISKGLLFLVWLNGTTLIGGVGASTSSVSAMPMSVALNLQYIPGSLTAQTFTVKAYSVATATTCQINQSNVSYGNSLNSSFTVQEVL